MNYTVALAGNPNAGKTTLFNALTGSHAHVGNWPGVTVEKKVGVFSKDPHGTLVDLPGIYSLSPYTLEEVVARNYLMLEQPDVIINIIDASNLERNLFLTIQLLEIGIPMVIACNMMDLIEKNNDILDISMLSSLLGVPVVGISALHGEGFDELIQKTRQAAVEKKAPHFHTTFSEKLENALQNFEKEIQKHPEKYQKGPYSAIHDRFLAIKLLEKDPELLASLKETCDLEAYPPGWNEISGEDISAMISTQRYQYIESILPQVLHRKEEDRLRLTDRIDRIVTHPVLSIPIFIAVIFIVYYLAISTVGSMGTDFMNDVVVGEWIQGGAGTLLENLGVSSWIISLIVDGMIAGVGAVIGFLPQMATLFLLLTILEHCGYMARIAFILDRIFRKFGLTGKSFIPMLVGTGCSVPGIMAARTIENENDRRMTAITTSFIPCGAKLPMIAFLSGAIFHGAWWFAPLCYFLGIFAVILSGIVLKKQKRFAGDPPAFIMELPEYRIPSIKGVLRNVWEQCAAFIRKAGTIILVSSIVLWFLQYYGITEQGLVPVNDQPEKSLLAAIGGLIAWVFTPLGFGDWQSTVATFTGLIAKENIMSTFGIVFGVTGEALDFIEQGDWSALQNITSHYTPLAAFSFLSFQLLCTPCFAAVGAMHRELGSAKWTWFGILYQTFLAYSFSLMIYQFGLLLKGNSPTIWSIAAALCFGLWLFLVFRRRRQQ